MAGRPWGSALAASSWRVRSVLEYSQARAKKSAGDVSHLLTKARRRAWRHSPTLTPQRFTGTATRSICLSLRAPRSLLQAPLYENQAFAYAPRALALQFHIEADSRSLERWYVGHSVELAMAGISVTDLRAAAANVADRLRKQARRIFAEWLRQIVQFDDRAAATRTGSAR
jgi:hypothetical protein